MNKYAKFGLMIATSTLVMMGLMFANVYALGHIYISQMRIFMALLMGSVMAIVMLLFMRRMFTNRKANIGIFAGSLLMAALSLILIRSQATVGDIAWMEAMISHHSSAILTSTNAQIEDPRVRELADGIIQVQYDEIAQMEALIEELKGGSGQ